MPNSTVEELNFVSSVSWFLTGNNWKLWRVKDSVNKILLRERKDLNLKCLEIFIMEVVEVLDLMVQ